MSLAKGALASKLEYFIPIAIMLFAFMVAIGFLEELIEAEKAIAALLGTLVLDSVIARRRHFGKIEGSLRSLRMGALQFLSRHQMNTNESFENFIARGNDVLFMGASLQGVVPPLRGFLKKRIDEGTTLRFLLLHPEAPFIESAARFHGVRPDSLRTDIASSLRYLREIKESVSRPEGMKIRTLQVSPSAAATIRDGKQDGGEIRYEMYLYGIDVAGRPGFCLTHADGEIYVRFRDTIEKLWNESEPWPKTLQAPAQEL